MVKSLWPMPSTGRSCRRTPASHWMLDRILWQIPMCCAASENMLGCYKCIRLEVFQSDRPIFCVCSPCLSMLQIHLQPLKKRQWSCSREPNITSLLVCYTLVYLVLIWTMATIVSIATSDSFYSYCCFNCFCSNFLRLCFWYCFLLNFHYEFQLFFLLVSLWFLLLLLQNAGGVNVCTVFLGAAVVSKGGLQCYRLRPLTAAWKSFDKSIKRYCKFQIQTSQHAAGLFRDCLACSNHGGIFFLRGVFWSFSVVPQKVTRGHDLDRIHMLIMLWLSLVWLLSSKPLKFPSPLGFTLGRGAKLFHA